MARRRTDDEDDDRDDIDEDDDIERRPKKKGGSSSAARDRLNVPAMCLIVVAGIAIVLNCVGIPFSIWGMVQGPRVVQMGGPGGVHLAGKQDLRRLGSALEVSGAGVGNLREVCQRSSAIAQDGRGAL